MMEGLLYLAAEGGGAVEITGAAEGGGQDGGAEEDVISVQNIVLDADIFDMSSNTKSNSPTKGTTSRAPRSPTGAWLSVKRLVEHEK